MPYVVHRSEYTLEAETLGNGKPIEYYSEKAKRADRMEWTERQDKCQWIGEFRVRAEAIDRAEALGAGHKVSFIITKRETDDWHSREMGRFDDGVYMHVPWRIGTDDYNPIQERLANEEYSAKRFPHLSLKDPGKVAFTETPEKGYLDRQTVMAAGRYLKRFFSDLDDDQIRQWAEQTNVDKFELKLATSIEDIRAAYYGNKMGSCMTYALCDYESSPHYPIDAYAGSDLAIAYYGPLNRVNARCVVWPEKKIYNRIFGSDTLRHLLENAGYRYDSLWGAKLTAINHRGRYVCPYLDNQNNVGLKSEDGKEWLVIGAGDWAVNNTSGLTGYCRDDDDNSWECEHCGDCYSEDDAQQEAFQTRGGSQSHRSITVCRHCYENNFVSCSNCDHQLPDDATDSDCNGDLWCTRCQIQGWSRCVVAGCAAGWHELTAFNDERDEDVSERICADHAYAWMWCHDCGGLFPRVSDSVVESVPEHGHGAMVVIPADLIRPEDNPNYSVGCDCSTCHRIEREYQVAIQALTSVPNVSAAAIVSDPSGFRYVVNPSGWSDGTLVIVIYWDGSVGAWNRSGRLESLPSWRGPHVLEFVASGAWREISRAEASARVPGDTGRGSASLGFSLDPRPAAGGWLDAPDLVFGDDIVF